MHIENAKKIVISTIMEVLIEAEDISDETQLLGGNAPLDSMMLVEVCLALEDRAEEHGFAFDWTSAVTLSNSRSMFRSVFTLAQEFANQSEA